MHLTDCCRFLISSAFKFTALCTILPHCVQSYRNVYNLTALCTILQHWGLEGRGGWALKPLMYSARLACLFGAHVHKNTKGLVIYMALYVMILMWANPLLGPLEGPSLWICPHQNHYVQGRINNTSNNNTSIGDFMYMGPKQAIQPGSGVPYMRCFRAHPFPFKAPVR